MKQEFGIIQIRCHDEKTAESLLRTSKCGFGAFLSTKIVRVWDFLGLDHIATGQTSCFLGAVFGSKSLSINAIVNVACLNLALLFDDFR